MKQIFLLLLIFAASCSGFKKGIKKNYTPKVMTGVIGEAQRNGDWKDVEATAKHLQVVFMSISKETSPDNALGMGTSSFDQVIYIVEGWAKAVLDGKIEMAQAGDMILIPQGTPHNLVNLNQEIPLKLISFYSGQEIPDGALYRTKGDELGLDQEADK